MALSEAKKRISRRFRRNRIAQIADLKNKPCMDCGNSFPAVCMDFDHRPGEVKLFNISGEGHGHPWKDVLNEIQKCDLVCANCHRIRTASRLVHLPTEPLAKEVKTHFGCGHLKEGNTYRRPTEAWDRCKICVARNNALRRTRGSCREEAVCQLS